MDPLDKTSHSESSPMNYLEKQRQPRSRKKLIVILIGILGTFTLISGTGYISIQYLLSRKPVSNTSIPIFTSNLVMTHTPFLPPTTQNNSLEKYLSSNQTILDVQYSPDQRYIALITYNSPLEILNLQKNSTGPQVLVFNSLVLINLQSGEKHEFNPYQIALDEIHYSLDKIPEQIQFSLYIDLLKWSPDNQQFWGVIRLQLPASPPINDSLMLLFNLSLKSFTFQKVTLPGCCINTLLSQNLNLANQQLLIETVSPKNELFLYLFDIQNKKQTALIHYPNAIFKKYFPGNYGYLVYFNPWFGNANTAARELEPKWIDNNTISYKDLETRKEIITKIGKSPIINQ